MANSCKHIAQIFTITSIQHSLEIANQYINIY